MSRFRYITPPEPYSAMLGYARGYKSLDGALDPSSKARADEGESRTCIDGLMRYAFDMAEIGAAFAPLPGVASTERDVDVSKLSMSVLLS